MFERKPHHRLPPYHRRLLCETLETRTLLSVSLAGASGAAQHQTLADLPVAAQHAISSAIGQDQSAYHATSGVLGVTLANPANGFTAQLQSGALYVSAGSDTWDMALTGLGYGGAMQPVGTAQTSAHGNRVDCNYGSVDEWYVNGPNGLEQGFTVAPPPQSNASGALTVVGRQVGNLSYTPQSNASGSLTVELALGGDLMGTVNAAGDGLALTRPDGSTALGYTGLTACDATGKTLPASLEVRADGGHQELLIHVNYAGAQGPITIDPFVQEAKLTASDGKAGDNFGFSVSISGNTLVVGAYQYRSDGTGAAYVFTDTASGWTKIAKLTASDGKVQDAFGLSVSISGNTVVVGADQYGSGGGPGAAYVFTEPASGWRNMTQTAKLTPSDGRGQSGFGYCVSVGGDSVVVNLAGDYTSAYVFTEPASGWRNMTQTAKLTPSDGNGLAGAVSINESGDTVLVGDYVFTEPASGWRNMTETAILAGGGFSFSINESGNTVVSSGGNAAYVFVEPASGWANMTPTAKLTAADGTNFGESVSISGNTVVVGAWQATVGGNGAQGAAYVFTEPASGWANMTETAKLTASDGEGIGYSVAISGNTVVVGAPDATVGGNTLQGAAYVFAPPPPLTVPATDWTSAGLTLTLGGDGNLHVCTTGTTTDAIPPSPPASVTNIEIASPSDTAANLTIDSTNGDPIPAGGLTYSGACGLIITGSGTVTLSGPNSYTGGTTVSAGTLLINASSALPGGGSLTIGTYGTFIFDPSSIAASSVKSATTAAPVTTNVVSSVPISSNCRVGPASLVERRPTVIENNTETMVGLRSPTHYAGTPDLVPPYGFTALQPPQSVLGVALDIPAKRIAVDPAWLAPAANSSDQQRKKDAAILAVETVFAQYEQ